MIKMYANVKPDDWNYTGCGVVPDKDENFCYECYLLTDSELEQLLLEAYRQGEKGDEHYKASDMLFSLLHSKKDSHE